MQAKIAVVAPHPVLSQQAREAVVELEMDAIVVEGDLAEGVAAAKRAVEKGAGVVVSRGGTAMMIAAELDVPVIEVEVSPFDIVHCLAALRGKPGPVGVVGFRNVVYGAASVGALLGIDLHEIVLTSRDEAQEKMAAAAAAGIRRIIGDAVAVKKAEELGLAGELIVSGKEAVVKALHTAAVLAEVRAREREKAELLRMVMDSVKDALIAVDRNGLVTLLNAAAEALLQVPSAEAVGSPLSRHPGGQALARLLAQCSPEDGELQKVGNKTVLMRCQPIRVDGQPAGMLAHFREITEVQRMERLVREKLHDKGLIAKIQLDDMIGASAAMTSLKDKIRKYAPVDATVLITGESGTGKEMVAQSLHNLSRHADGPFVAINCAALPATLLESELFGYEEGAFTGARRGGKPGLFELAHRGTVFLDEIGEMPLALQSRLLRVLQEKEVLRLGGERLTLVNVRVIAATNRNLVKGVGEGYFREDLYYRLNLLELLVPPLRDRKEDVALLANFFLKKHATLNSGVTGMEPGAVALLQQYDWPGNVRELEHIVQRLLILSEKPVISTRLTMALLQELALEPPAASPPPVRLADLEMQAIMAALEAENFNQSRAARRLGIDRSTLWRKIRIIAKNNKSVVKYNKNPLLNN